jgi:hypothetical protein
VNQPPAPPSITGPRVGALGQSYNFTFLTTDPEENVVFYSIDWGEGNTSGWIGPYQSGEHIIVGHSWSTRGIFIVKAKAKDSNGVVSAWGTLRVIMPLSYTMQIGWSWAHFLQRYPHSFPILKHILNY